MKPVSRVSVVSTGTVQIRPEHVETNGTPPLLLAAAPKQHGTGSR